ncbi:amidohydrolase family protein [Xanthobacter sp. DSM 24535]|uniref:amidohydrolase family protein n=1 Tax=Roseixanthobacter psychrophilus TaxID=3119917 RepID=UPI003727EC00
MKIALEEHFMLPDFIPYLDQAMPKVSPQGRASLIAAMSDFGEQRLAAMASAGVERAVLSLSGPGVQVEPDTAVAVKMARRANDLLAAEVAKRADRYSGFAHLAMQDASAAADELERCVRELGFVGAMVNGQTNGIYLDDPRYDVFWERLQALDLPLYLHPGDSYVLPYVLEGAPELLKPTWEWNIETSSHFLRLVFAGVFDRFPGLKIVLGHMGETLPYVLWRLDSRSELIVGKRPLQLAPSAYCRRNLFVTTSGQCDTVPLLAAIGGVGADHVLFSVDYPYEDSAIAGKFLDDAPLDGATRAKVAYLNAASLMRLKL